jgi:glutamate-ammonia-ligase adenylyltransferase
MPDTPDELRVLGRALGLAGNPAEAVVALWQSHAREVRRIHERLFYRPLLAAAARLSTDEAVLSPQQARERLAALGFRDPGWGDASPRGAHHWGVATGRDPAHATARHARVVRRRGRSGRGFAGLPSGERRPRHDPLVPQDAPRRGQRRRAPRARPRPQPVCRRPAHPRARVGVDPRRPRWAAAAQPGLVGDHPAQRRSPQGRPGQGDGGRGGVASPRARCGSSWATSPAPSTPDQVGAALADLAGATIEAALDVATRVVGARNADGLLVDVLVVGMGSLGRARAGLCLGRRRDDRPSAARRGVGRGRPPPGVAVVQELVRLVAATAPDALLLDADLRPEGKNGPLSRSLDRVCRRTTSAGPSPGSSRRSCGPGRSPVTERALGATSQPSSTRCAIPLPG